jgi:hypothetical protein
VRLSLSLRPALEMGSLQVAAALQDPDIRLEADTSRLRVVEGAVELLLTFPDLEALQRFQHRVDALRLCADT